MADRGRRSHEREGVQVIGNVQQGDAFDEEGAAGGVEPAFVDWGMGSGVRDLGSCVRAVEGEGFATGHGELAEFQRRVLQAIPVVRLPGDLLRVGRVEKFGDHLHGGRGSVQAVLAGGRNLLFYGQIALEAAALIFTDEIGGNSIECVPVSHSIGGGKVALGAFEGGDEDGVAAIVKSDADRARF